MTDWYECVEEPLRNLIRLLRNNGFNTYCSCGHKPEPYIQIEWYQLDELSRLYDLLIENGYKNFVIEARQASPSHPYYSGRKFIELKFWVDPTLISEPADKPGWVKCKYDLKKKQELAKESDIRDLEGLA